MELTERAAAEVEKLRAAVAPVIVTFTKDLDPALMQEFMDAVAAARCTTFRQRPTLPVFPV